MIVGQWYKVEYDYKDQRPPRPTYFMVATGPGRGGEGYMRVNYRRLNNRQWAADGEIDLMSKSWVITPIKPTKPVLLGYMKWLVSGQGEG